MPHWYGVASVKWLTRIDVSTEPYKANSRPATTCTSGPIDLRTRNPDAGTCSHYRPRSPRASIPVGSYTIRGKAWSGTGPRDQVDISLTGEGDWHRADLESPAGPYQWQDWSFDCQRHPGRHALRARATDAAGHVQPDVPPWNRLGYGNNAVEVIYVDVR